jgi:RNA polymerase sigma factor (sigma-70 family)
MREHDGLVHHIVRRQWGGRLSYAEVLQEGRIGLWHAILGFDPQRGVAFSTYASQAIARQVWRAVAQAEEQEQEGEGVEPCAAPVDPWAHLLEREIKTALYALVARLPHQQRWLVCARYGLDGQGARSLAELGAQLGCTRQAIQYHLRRALLRLRHPAFNAHLRALVGRNRRQDYLRALRPARRRP